MMRTDSPRSQQTFSTSLDKELAGDITAAKSIAEQVATGVGAVGAGVEAATKSPLKKVAEAPKKLALITDQVREDFFRTEVPFGSERTRHAGGVASARFHGPRDYLDAARSSETTPETLAELDIELRGIAEAAGLRFLRVPVPHDDPRFAKHHQ